MLSSSASSEQRSNTVIESKEHVFHYIPHPLPDNQPRMHTFRNDVRCTVLRLSFQPSLTCHTLILEIYVLLISDNNYASSSPELLKKFRSALGCVLIPPSNAGAFARSFSVASLSRCNRHISTVSADCTSVDLAVKLRELKHQNGVQRRQCGDNDAGINKLRENWRARKVSLKENGSDGAVEAPQHISLRYVDEFLPLNCAEDLLKLKVTYLVIGLFWYPV